MIPENGFVLDAEEWISADVFKMAEEKGIDIDKGRSRLNGMVKNVIMGR